MIRVVKITAIILLSGLIVLTALGIFAPKNVYLSESKIIKAPPTVVWRFLADIENHPQWRNDIREIKIKNSLKIKSGTDLYIFMKHYDPAVFHQETISSLDEGKSITFRRHGINENLFMRDYQYTYQIKRLADGTTKISGIIQYTTYGLTTKIYNQLFLKPALSANMESNLENLMRLFEGN